MLGKGVIFIFFTLSSNICSSAFTHIWSWVTPQSESIGFYYNVGPPFAPATLLGRLSTGFKSLDGNFRPFLQKRGHEVGWWCWMRKPGSLFLLQFIPKAFQDDIKILWRPLKLFHIKLPHPCFYGPWFVQCYTVLLKQEGIISKLSPKHQDHEMVKNTLVVWSKGQSPNPGTQHHNHKSSDGVRSVRVENSAS